MKISYIQAALLILIFICMEAKDAGPSNRDILLFIGLAVTYLSQRANHTTIIFRPSSTIRPEDVSVNGEPLIK